MRTGRGGVWSVIMANGNENGNENGNGNGDEIDPAVKQRALEEFFKNPGARTHIAQSMSAVIRRNMYQVVPKHKCHECGMGWEDDSHVHDGEECAVYSVHES